MIYTYYMNAYVSKLLEFMNPKPGEGSLFCCVIFCHLTLRELDSWRSGPSAPFFGATSPHTGAFLSSESTMFQTSQISYSKSSLTLKPLRLLSCTHFARADVCPVAEVYIFHGDTNYFETVIISSLPQLGCLLYPQTPMDDSHTGRGCQNREHSFPWWQTEEFPIGLIFFLNIWGIC